MKGNSEITYLFTSCLFILFILLIRAPFLNYSHRFDKQNSCYEEFRPQILMNWILFIFQEVLLQILLLDSFFLVSFLMVKLWTLKVLHFLKTVTSLFLMVPGDKRRIYSKTMHFYMEQPGRSAIHLSLFSFFLMSAILLPWFQRP